MKSRMSGLVVILVLCATVMIFGQSKDIGGTWSGDTVVPNSPDKDVITLVLKKAGESFTGTISDSLGMLNGTPLEKVTFEKDTLSFEFMVATGSEYIRARMTLKISGEKLGGSWETEDGTNGQLELARMK